MKTTMKIIARRLAATVLAVVTGVAFDAAWVQAAVTDSQAAVQKMYVAYYGRPADPAGQAYWAAQLDAAGVSVAGILAAFSTSSEFSRRYGGLAYPALVTRVYQQTLGREPDPAGLAWYVGELQAGRRTPQSITFDVLNGATTPPDSTVVASKVDVAAYYTAKVAAGCPYGTEEDGVAILSAVTAVRATVAAAKAAIDARPCSGGGGPGGMNTANTISDQAQSATIAFDGLAFVTGSFCAQTFYPPGKVADFFGFQYLRDNDPTNLGHNTEFTTLTADPVLAVMTDAQIAVFVTLAQAERALSDQYGYARFPLAKAFRRLADSDLPAGTDGLDRSAVKAYSASLFAIDGQMSLLRAKAYAQVLNSMTAAQKAVLDAMKGTGAATWIQPPSPPAALQTYRQYSVELRTYAGEMLAWYVGNSDADVYFCPERQGTYFGSFFMKDIKAMHNPNYTISSNMTAEMGDAFLAQLDASQRAKITGLVSQQKADLLALVARREDISDALRELLVAGGMVSDNDVLTLARQYGELDGEISYYYATAFSEVAASLTPAQKATLLALRKTATAESGGSPDYDASCGNGFLYSSPLASPPVIENTDFLFGSSFSSSMTLTSAAFVEGGRIATTYTCDGMSVSPALSWSGAPAGTAEYALTLTTVALDGTKYNWVLYGIPASANGLVQGSTGVGTAGRSTDGPELRYYAPCSTGPGDKTYIFTLYALSGAPSFPVPAAQVDGPALEAAIAGVTLGRAQLSFVYARQGL